MIPAVLRRGRHLRSPRARRARAPSWPPCSPPPRSPWATPRRRNGSSGPAGPRLPLATRGDLVRLLAGIAGGTLLTGALFIGTLIASGYAPAGPRAAGAPAVLDRRLRGDRRHAAGDPHAARCRAPGPPAQGASPGRDLAAARGHHAWPSGSCCAGRPRSSSSTSTSSSFPWCGSPPARGSAGAALAIGFIQAGHRGRDPRAGLREPHGVRAAGGGDRAHRHGPLPRDHRRRAPAPGRGASQVAAPRRRRPHGRRAGPRAEPAAHRGHELRGRREANRRRCPRAIARARRRARAARGRSASRGPGRAPHARLLPDRLRRVPARRAARRSRARCWSPFARERRAKGIDVRLEARRAARGARRRAAGRDRPAQSRGQRDRRGGPGRRRRDGRDRDAATTAGAFVVTTVRDNGPGLSPEAGARLFEPFATTRASGMGMGLAISRAIVEAHGGTLWAVDGPGGCFRFTLPVGEDADE